MTDEQIEAIILKMSDTHDTLLAELRKLMKEPLTADLQRRLVNVIALHHISQSFATAEIARVFRLSPRDFPEPQ